MTPTPSPFSYLIAVSGGSGSGKSTLAAALVASLTPARAVIFKEDAYYWPLSYYGDPVDAAARAELTAKIDYDHPASKDTELIADHLGALKRGQAIDQPIYDYETHDRLPGQTYRIEPRKIIILEGIHALSASAILPLIDLSVYVDTPDDLRLARRIQRDVIERERNVTRSL
ncbi:MAG: uridine kinase [Pseudomonadota bacterium]